MQMDRAVYARHGGDPTGVDDSPLPVRQRADALKARQADPGDAPAANVSAREVLELQRRRVEAARRHEQVGANEQLLRSLRAADERHDLLDVRAVADDLARHPL